MTLICASAATEVQVCVMRDPGTARQGKYVWCVRSLFHALRDKLDRDNDLPVKYPKAQITANSSINPRSKRFAIITMSLTFGPCSTTHSRLCCHC
jgi:hypothetical protein